MRTIRALTTALVLVGVLPTLGAAQGGRPFKDSWYWGAKAGTMMYSTISTSNAMAPAGGLDWLITRSKAGIYMSYSQAFFNRIEYMQAEGDTVRGVNLKDLRRIDIAAMVFPGTSNFFKPYAGLGLTMAQIATAEKLGTFQNVDQFQAADALVTELRTSVTPMIMAGAQVQLHVFSVFAQGSAIASQKSFFLHGNNSFNLWAEAGIRLNFGSSIDKND